MSEGIERTSAIKTRLHGFRSYSAFFLFKMYITVSKGLRAYHELDSSEPRDCTFCASSQIKATPCETDLSRNIKFQTDRATYHKSFSLCQASHMKVIVMALD